MQFGNRQITHTWCWGSIDGYTGKYIMLDR